VKLIVMMSALIIIQLTELFTGTHSTYVGLLTDSSSEIIALIDTELGLRYAERAS
jgi:hypothetical protein